MGKHRTRRERSFNNFFPTAQRRMIEKNWPDVREVEGKMKCKWQNAQVATKEIPAEHKEKRRNHCESG